MAFLTNISLYFENDARHRHLQWKTNKNSHAIYRTVPFPMILSDPNLDFKVTIV